jgi:hypothetical protein
MSGLSEREVESLMRCVISGLCKREVLNLIERIPNEIEWLYEGPDGKLIPLRRIELVHGKVRLS